MSITPVNFYNTHFVKSNINGLILKLNHINLLKMFLRDKYSFFKEIMSNHVNNIDFT